MASWIVSHCIIFLLLNDLSWSSPLWPPESRHRASRERDGARTPPFVPRDPRSPFPPALNGTERRARTRALVPDSKEPPEYMMELYERLSKGRSASPSASIVRSFKNKDSSLFRHTAGGVRIYPLLFNISMPHREHIRLAELRFFIQIQQPHQGPDCSLTVYYVPEGVGWSPGAQRDTRNGAKEKVLEGKGLEELVTKHVNARDNGWVSFDLTHAAAHWQKSGSAHHRLQVHVKDAKETLSGMRSNSDRSSDEKHKSNSDRSSDEKHKSNSDRSSDEKHKSNSDRSLDEKHKSNSDRSSDEKHKSNSDRSSDEKHKSNSDRSSDEKHKSNSDEKHNAAMIIFSDNQSNNNDTKLNLMIAREHNTDESRSLWKAPDHNTDHLKQEEVKHQSLQDVNFISDSPSRIRRNAKSDACKRTPLFVDFKDIGWDTWVIQPLGYEAYSCRGECYPPLTSEVTPTRHAVVQTLLSVKSPDRVLRACCVPTKLEPISLLYHENGVITFNHKYEGMVVTECGCR